MSRIVVQSYITLDGVVQSGGDPDEDRDGGFAHGGWMSAYNAQHDTHGEFGEIVGAWENNAEALLLGRKTYEIFASSWGTWDKNVAGMQGDMTRRYNRIPKYVASRTLTEVGWQNAQLLGPDVPAAVQKLRAEPGGEIHVWGSAELIKALAEHDLVDAYRLAVYPIVLGTGKKLFSDGFAFAKLTLVETRALRSGVLVTTYRRSDAG